jgi:hypothetical protein
MERIAVVSPVRARTFKGGITGNLVMDVAPASKRAFAHTFTRARLAGTCPVSRPAALPTRREQKDQR